MEFRTGRSVRFVHRQLTGVDSFGNDVYGSLAVDVQGCAVSPGSSSEDWQGTATITSEVTVHAPVKTMVNLPLDQMIIDGKTFNIVGEPNSWASPWTATTGYMEIHGREITSGGPAT